MSIPVFPPSREGDLSTWTANFNTKINADPTIYGLSLTQASAYTPLSDAYIAAYSAVVNPNTNSKQAVIAKNEAKETLLNGAGGAWELVRIVQAFPGTTDAMRGELGLRIYDNEPTPIAPPTTSPVMSVISTMGRTVRIRLRDADNPDSRGKPAGVDGATILTYVGESAPASVTDWVFDSNTGRTIVDITFPPSVAEGAKVWITAFWFNGRKESGPAATPIYTNVAGGVSAEAA